MTARTTLGAVRSLFTAPGDELVGSDEDETRLVLLAASIEGVSNDLERQSRDLRGAFECRDHLVVGVEREQRERRTQPLKHILARRERLRTEMMTRPRF